MAQDRLDSPVDDGHTLERLRYRLRLMLDVIRELSAAPPYFAQAVDVCHEAARRGLSPEDAKQTLEVLRKRSEVYGRGGPDTVAILTSPWQAPPAATAEQRIKQSAPRQLLSQRAEAPIAAHVVLRLALKESRLHYVFSGHAPARLSPSWEAAWTLWKQDLRELDAVDWENRLPCDFRWKDGRPLEPEDYDDIEFALLALDPQIDAPTLTPGEEPQYQASAYRAIREALLFVRVASGRTNHRSDSGGLS